MKSNIKSSRRVFMMQVVGAASAFAFVRNAAAAAKLDVNDSYAKSMGFKLNTTEVDETKYKKHTADQKCSTCQLWNGRENKSVAGYGNCSFFDDAMTPENGWCKNFKVLKKA